MPRTSAALVALALGLLSLSGCARARSEDPKNLVYTTDPGEEAMTLFAGFQYGRKSWNLPITTLRVTGPNQPKLPVALIVAGCGHAEQARDFPDHVVRLSVHQNPNATVARTAVEGCAGQDARAIANGVRAKLDFALSELDRVGIADPNRVVIYASGEAAPIVAAYRAKVRGKILEGDPCLVAWPTGDLDVSTPTVVLWGTVPRGLGWKPASGPTADLGSATTAGAPFEDAAMVVVACEAQVRPELPHNYKVILHAGEVTTFGRPGGLQQAGKDEFLELVR